MDTQNVHVLLQSGRGVEGTATAQGSFENEKEREEKGIVEVEALWMMVGNPYLSHTVVRGGLIVLVDRMSVISISHC